MKTLKNQLNDSLINESSIENQTALNIKGCHCLKIFDNDLYDEYKHARKPGDIVKLLKNRNINLKDYDIVSIIGVEYEYEDTSAYIIAKIDVWKKYLIRYVDGDENFDLGSQKYITQWLEGSGNDLARWGKPFDVLVEI